MLTNVWKTQTLIVLFLTQFHSSNLMSTSLLPSIRSFQFTDSIRKFKFYVNLRKLFDTGFPYKHCI